MNLSDIIVDRESFDDALNYLETKKGIRLSDTQKAFIELVKQVPVSKRMVVKANYGKFLTIDSESEEIISIAYPPRTGRMYAIEVIFACICVSQPNRNCAILFLTNCQAKAFITDVSKILDLFKESKEFTWDIDMKDARRVIQINAKKYHSYNRVKAYSHEHKKFRGVEEKCFLIDLQ